MCTLQDTVRASKCSDRSGALSELRHIRVALVEMDKIGIAIIYVHSITM